MLPGTKNIFPLFVVLVEYLCICLRNQINSHFNVTRKKILSSVLMFKTLKTLHTGKKKILDVLVKSTTGNNESLNHCLSNEFRK